MKVKRYLFLIALSILFVVCFYKMNETYDELARYPYATSENHDLILKYLNEKDIDYLLAQNIRPEQFLPYVECEGFQLHKTLWYDKAMTLQNADASSIVSFINTWNEHFTFKEMDGLFTNYTYDQLQAFFTQGDEFVEGAKLLTNPSDPMTVLTDQVSLYRYVPNDLTKITSFPSVNINQTASKEVYVREAVIEPLAKMAEALTQASGKTNYDLIVVGGFVPYEEQMTLYQNALLQYGAEQFQQYEDYPGHSENQLGFSVRFSIAGLNSLEEIMQSEQVAWLNAHAHEYGFIVRYPLEKEAIAGKAAQPLTLRYVGEETATKLKEKNFTLEEMSEQHEK